jgi:hypothetical protein
MKAAACGLPAGLLAALLCAGPASAQESKSASLAKELASALQAAKLGNIAAKDASAPGRFVGALHLPGLQLLVISAVYQAPALLDARLLRKEYREVYVDLNSASQRESRVMITDLGVNGLVADPGGDQPADTYDAADKSTVFDHNWRRQQLSEEEYLKIFAEADARYAQMLTALMAQLKAAP